MITSQSDQREIEDLQRLLLALGLMEFTASSRSGVWGDETQQAVLAAYAKLGWAHDEDATWITAPALAALASALHQHPVDDDDTTGEGVGGGSHIGGSGSHIGGSGSHIGGSGSHIGGSGSHIGGSGSHIGGSGSHIGGSGSHIGGSGSHIGSTSGRRRVAGAIAVSSGRARGAENADASARTAPRPRLPPTPVMSWLFSVSPGTHNIDPLSPNGYIVTLSPNGYRCGLSSNADSSTFPHGRPRRRRPCDRYRRAGNSGRR
jgi:hypothetical protein